MSLRHCEYILDVIETIRGRKSRPDWDNIKVYAQRHYGVSAEQVKQDLELLIQAEIIGRVDYKGKASYRNLHKPSSDSEPSTMPSSPAGVMEDASEPSSEDSNGPLEPMKFSSAVTAAIAAILTDQPMLPSQMGGVNFRSISSYLMSRDHGRYSRRYIEQLIERETSLGNVIQVAPEIYHLPPDDVQELDKHWQREHNPPARVARPPPAPASNANVRPETAENNRPMQKINPAHILSPFVLKKKQAKELPPPPPRERATQRTKRVKKVFDPSDIEIPKKRGRPPGSTKKLQLVNSNKDILGLTKTKLQQHQQQQQAERRDSWSLTSAAIPLNTPSRSSSPVHVKSRCSSANETETITCRLCQHGACNAQGKCEDLLSCTTCQVHVHPTCLGFGGLLSRKVLLLPSWHCPDCRPCSVCSRVENTDTMLLCLGCDTTVHMSCTDPPVVDKVQKYYCSTCKVNHASVPSSTPAGSPMPELKAEEPSHPKPASKTVQSDVPVLPSLNNLASFAPWLVGCRQLELKGPPLALAFDAPLDPTIPEAHDWTWNDVASYFESKGFAEEAQAFRDQEVDGPSLLLMKRSDILTGMGFKLGPALKIYHLLRKLQTRRNLLYP